MESYLNMKNIFRIDSSTYLLMLLGLLSGYIKNVFIILIIVLIHEIGHVFFFYLFNIEIESIVIYPFGGVSKINKRIHERIYKDIFVSLGGILFQLLLFIIMYFLYKNGFIVSSTYHMFNTYNRSIILFNLIPIIPLDGSKLFFALFTKFLSFRLSYILMVIVGIISLVLFILYNCIFKINDMVIYVFLIVNLYLVFKDYKYVMNKFYLERIMYDNYYNGIVNDSSIDNIRLDKYYYFKVGKGYINEKKYILKNKF